MEIGQKVRAQEPFFKKKYRNRIKNWAIRDIVQDEIAGTLLECVEWYKRQVRHTRIVYFKPEEVACRHPSLNIKAASSTRPECSK